MCHDELHFTAKCSAIFLCYSLNINSIVSLELVQVCCVKEGSVSDQSPLLESSLQTTQ